MSELSNRPVARQPAGSFPEPHKAWLTYAEAGALVGLSRGTLWKLIGAGEVKAARVGRAVRIDRESLNAYMKRAAENAVGQGANTSDLRAGAKRYRGGRRA